MSPNKIDLVTLIARVQDVVNTVSVEGGYVVIVCPTTNISTQLSIIVGSLVSEKGEFSGRTAVLPNKGKISIVCAEEKIFASDDEIFRVEFIGWSSKNDSRGMLKWQSRATV